jgi:hypothetical protein
MRLCNHWFTDATTMSEHCPPRLHFEPLKLLNLTYADLDPAFHSNANPDLASQNNADPCVSGSPPLQNSILD